MTLTITATECLTFPRSGHHLLQKILTQYFGNEFVYCELYADPEQVISLNERTNYQKNHDLDLTTPIRDNRQYIVQIRYPIDSIVSWFKQDCQRGRAHDSPGDWTSFALTKSSFWMRFYRKWVLDHVPSRLIVNYADLICEPVRTVTAVVRFLTQADPDEGRISSICQSMDIGRKNHYSAFKYYGVQFFDLFKGLFAAIPGVDITNDELLVDNGESDRLYADVSRIVHELGAAGHNLLSLAQRLNETTALSQSAGVPQGQGI